MRCEVAGAAILTCLVALSGSPASGEEGGPLARGRLVRVTVAGPAERPVVGDLMAIEPAQITIRRSGSSEVVAIPRGEVTRLEVSTRKARRGHGAKIGALVGLGVGAVLGFAAGDDCGGAGAPSIVCIPRPASAAGVGLAGAGVGALVGLALAPDRTIWHSVDPGGPQLGVAPKVGRGGGMGLTLSLSF